MTRDHVTSSPTLDGLATGDRGAMAGVASAPPEEEAANSSQQLLAAPSRDKTATVAVAVAVESRTEDNGNVCGGAKKVTMDTLTIDDDVLPKRSPSEGEFRSRTNSHNTTSSTGEDAEPLPRRNSREKRTRRHSQKRKHRGSSNHSISPPADSPTLHGGARRTGSWEPPESSKRRVDRTYSEQATGLRRSATERRRGTRTSATAIHQDRRHSERRPSVIVGNDGNRSIRKPSFTPSLELGQPLDAVAPAAPFAPPPQLHFPIGEVFVASTILLCGLIALIVGVSGAGNVWVITGGVGMVFGGSFLALGLGYYFRQLQVKDQAPSGGDLRMLTSRDLIAMKPPTGALVTETKGRKSSTSARKTKRRAQLGRVGGNFV